MRIHAKIENKLKITDLYTVFEKEHTKDYNFRGESHDFWELVIVLDGAVSAVINNEVYQVDKNNCIIHEPMEFHRLWVEGGDNARIMVFTFSAEFMPEIDFKIFKIDESGCKFAKQIIDEIKFSFDVQDISAIGINDGCEVLADIAIKKLEILLLEIITKHIKTEKISKPKRVKVFEEIIKQIEPNIDKDLSVFEIAKMCNISESYLQKVFRKYVGMGVITYFNRMKMTYAIIMLQSGMSVLEVSEKLGFSNPNYFSVAFKRIIGKNPSEYKNSEKF